MQTTRRAPLVFGGVAIVVYALDQVTKALVVAHLTPDVPRHFIGSLLKLHLIRNSGAAFSTGTSHTTIFTVLAFIAIGVVVWLMSRTRSNLWAVAFGFLLAGVAGNLTDRIAREPQHFQGHVVDFLELPHWPIFNVADMSINVAAVLIVIAIFLGIRLNGTRATEHAGQSKS